MKYFLSPAFSHQPKHLLVPKTRSIFCPVLATWDVCSKKRPFRLIIFFHTFVDGLRLEEAPRIVLFPPPDPTATWLIEAHVWKLINMLLEGKERRVVAFTGIVKLIVDEFIFFFKVGQQFPFFGLILENMHREGSFLGFLWGKLINELKQLDNTDCTFRLYACLKVICKEKCGSDNLYLKELIF